MTTPRSSRRAARVIPLDDTLLRTLLDHSPDNIYFKDTASQFVRINRAMANYFGLRDPVDAIGKTDFDFFSAEHARAAFTDEATVMKTGRALVGKEEKETWPDGRETWVSTTKVPLRDADGKIVGSCGISRDVTERKRAEQALQRAHAELERRVQERTEALAEAVARLEAHDRAKSLFISTVSHEIKNPVGSITYSVHNLLKGIAGPLSEKAMHYLRLLQEDCDRLEFTISDVLDMSRIEAGALQLNRTAVDLVTLDRRVADRVAYLIESRHQQLLVDAATPTMMVEGDTEKLERAVLNVVRNAIKYTPEGGHIRLELMAPKTWTDERGVEVVIRVMDDGRGIPSQYLPKVTDRYFRVNENVSGTGLGLTICKEIVEIHGGRLAIESPPPGLTQGTEVRLYLPLDTNNSRQAKALASDLQRA